MHGIIHEVAPPYAPQSNGKNRTLLDMVNAMLVSYGLPKNMCGEALYFACQILNRVPYKIFEKTPYELWRKRESNLKYFKV